MRPHQPPSGFIVPQGALVVRRVGASVNGWVNIAESRSELDFLVVTERGLILDPPHHAQTISAHGGRGPMPTRGAMLPSHSSPPQATVSDSPNQSSQHSNRWTHTRGAVRVKQDASETAEVKADRLGHLNSWQQGAFNLQYFSCDVRMAFLETRR